MPTKSLWASKTVWLNLATFLAAIIAVPEITGIIPAAAMPYLLALNAALNIFLRVFMTNTAIGGAKAEA